MRRTMFLFILLVGTLASGAARGQEVDAADLWHHRCAMCHGEDGAGRTRMGQLYSVPDFTSKQWQRARSDDQIRAAILGGGNGMPAFRKRLKREQVEALIKFIRRFGG